LVVTIADVHEVVVGGGRHLVDVGGGRHLVAVTLVHGDDPKPGGVRVRFGRERGGWGEIVAWGDERGGCGD
jgi:hypothetical protein